MWLYLLLTTLSTHAVLAPCAQEYRAVIPYRGHPLQAVPIRVGFAGATQEAYSSWHTYRPTPSFLNYAKFANRNGLEAEILRQKLFNEVAVYASREVGMLPGHIRITEQEVFEISELVPFEKIVAFEATLHKAMKRHALNPDLALTER